MKQEEVEPIAGEKKKEQKREDFDAGDKVIIQAPHLEGLKAEVVDQDATDNYICRISEHQYEGFLVSLDALHLKRAK